MRAPLTECSSGCGGKRTVWFIHGASNCKVHAFSRQLRALSIEYPSLNVHVRYSRPLEGDVEGKHYDSAGHVDLNKSLLPFDEYELYLRRPLAFLECISTGLNDLNVPDERVHYDFFGPGATLLKEQHDTPMVFSKDLAA